jgi:signal transduction histidine kinase
VTRFRPFAQRYWFDLLVVIAALACALEVAFANDSAQAPRTTSWFAVPAIAVFVLALLARRRFPFAAPAAVWLLGAAISFADGRLMVFPVAATLIGMAAALLLGNLRDERQSRVGLAVTLVASTIIVSNDPSNNAGEFVFIPGLFAISWLVGFALRGRAEQAEAAEARASQAEHDRESAARVAVAEERARIARELHDIVAHSVSVMVLQVGAVRHKLPGTLASEVDALQDVERTGRGALAEMRRLLGAMRRESDDVEMAPQPGLDRLEALVAELGRAGLPVRLRIEGDPGPLPAAVDLSAYRIVQEGLTNALKHAGATQVEVALRYRRDELGIEVRDNGRGDSNSDGLGHGLVGIRERVKLYGGEMTAGAASGGGFVLSTRLPITGDRA